MAAFCDQKIKRVHLSSLKLLLKWSITRICPWWSNFSEMCFPFYQTNSSRIVAIGGKAGKAGKAWKLTFFWILAEKSGKWYLFKQHTGTAWKSIFLTFQYYFIDVIKDCNSYLGK